MAALFVTPRRGAQFAYLLFDERLVESLRPFAGLFLHRFMNGIYRLNQMFKIHELSSFQFFPSKRPRRFVVLSTVAAAEENDVFDVAQRDHRMISGVLSCHLTSHNMRG